MTSYVEHSARSLIARCDAVDWQAPAHDPVRAKATYNRWLDIFGLKRQFRWLPDPADASVVAAPMETMAHAWALGAARMPPPASSITLIANSARAEPPGDRAVRSELMRLASNLSVGVASYLSEARGYSTALLSSWDLAIARHPKIALGLSLLTPFVLPGMTPPVATAMVRDSLTACLDLSLWQKVERHLAALRAEADKQSISAAEFTQEGIMDALMAAAEPLVEACEAGAFAHALLDDEIVVVAAPSISCDGRHLHNANGPALGWSRTKLFAWKGVPLPERLVVRPETVTRGMIWAMPDATARATLVDLYAHTHGHEACMRDLGGVVEHEDTTGRLWRLPVAPLGAHEDDDIKTVEVVNGTAEPDGSRRTHWLRVPPDMQTAQQAVAWTYGLKSEDYSGLVMRT